MALNDLYSLNFSCVFESYFNLNPNQGQLIERKNKY